MPPKPKKPNEPSKKTEKKKLEQIIEEKTFGLKNRKGAKAQKYIAQIEKQVRGGNQKLTKSNAEVDKQKKKKDDKKKELDELNSLFKPLQQNVARGVDPKSVLCQFFRQGQCKKGDKCKLSHDIAISRKSEKKSIYEDTRDADMVVDPTKPKCTIICKSFLDAVENNKYGWFWTCPNGGDKCIYRHAVPQGYVLKKDKKKDDKGEEISMEELIENERAALGVDTTKVTLDSFLKWKERKRKEKIVAMEKETEKRKNAFKQGKLMGISGRQMFEFKPDMVFEDDEEAQEGDLERDSEDEDEDDTVVVEINQESLESQAKEADGTGTQMTAAARKALVERLQAESEEAHKLDMAGALPVSGDLPEGGTTAYVNGQAVADMPIDEDLFDGDDIDLLEEDLDDLDVDD